MPTLILYPFRIRDPLTGLWLRARHKMQVPELQGRYSDWEITGTPEVRHVAPVGGEQCSPFQSPAQVHVISAERRDNGGICDNL